MQGATCMEFVCEVDDITGFRYANRLSETGSVAIEICRIKRRVRRKLLDTQNSCSKVAKSAMKKLSQHAMVSKVTVCTSFSSFVNLN